LSKNSLVEIIAKVFNKGNAMTSRRSNPRAISEPAAIEVLASPVRHELVDTLSALGGEANVAVLAETLGHPADGLYYHLRLLCKAGLVTEKKRAGGERLYRLAGRRGQPLRLAYRAGAAGNAPALLSYVHGLLQVAGKDFEQALISEGVVMHGPRRQLWAARNKGWLSASDVEQVNVLLERLCMLTTQPRGPGRETLLTLAFFLSPARVRSKRRPPKS
jgi:DNA-binding transcriptional ArsR family regulator